MAFSVGIGLTNDCNLKCAHCYRPTDGVYALSLQDVKAVCDSLPVASVGLGTGENALHPQFLDIVAYLRERGIRMSIASNGYSLKVIPREHLRAFRDVEVSIDFPTREQQDQFRGDGNWQAVHDAMERCRKEGVEVSILATMMNTNYDKMDALARMAQSHGVNLRVNVYQSVRNERFALSYEQFWEGYRRLFGAARLVSCTEPVVRGVLGLGSVRSPCGYESVRVTPQHNVLPCVYWPGSGLKIEDLVRLGERILDTEDFQQARSVPESAKGCLCQGGCASRRALSGNLDQHDRYCPWVRKDRVALTYQEAPAKDLVRARNYCTTIVI
jgi:MoaA/NifB/PqqE/SkfB family radical SAM enzyme